MKVGKRGKVLSQSEVGNKISGTSLKGYLDGYYYEDLVKAFGQPTYIEASDDHKVQKEWVIRFEVDGEYKYATVYDWKTYDEEYTMTLLNTWNIGGHEKYIALYVQGVLDYQLNQLKKYE